MTPSLQLAIIEGQSRESNLHKLTAINTFQSNANTTTTNRRLVSSSLAESTV